MCIVAVLFSCVWSLLVGQLQSSERDSTTSTEVHRRDGIFIYRDRWIRINSTESPYVLKFGAIPAHPCHSCTSVPLLHFGATPALSCHSCTAVPLPHFGAIPALSCHSCTSVPLLHLGNADNVAVNVLSYIALLKKVTRTGAILNVFPDIILTILPSLEQRQQNHKKKRGEVSPFGIVLGRIMRQPLFQYPF